MASHSSKLDREKIAQIEEVEQQIETLRKQKTDLPEAVYYAQLELHLLDLASLMIPPQDAP